MNPVSRDDSYPQIVSNVYVEKINANESLPESNNDGGDDDDDSDDGDVCEAEAVKHLTDNLCEDKNGNLSEENNEFLMMVHCKNRKHLNKKLSKTGLPNKSKRDYHLHRSSDHNSNSDVRESPDDDGCCNNVCSKFYKRNSEDSLSNYEIAAWTVSLSTSQSKSGSPGTVDLESVSEDEITLESENSYHIIDLKNENRDGQFNSSSFPVAVSVENDVSEITKPVDLSHFKNAFVDKHKKDSLLKTQKLTNLSSVRHTTLGDSVIQDSENDSAKGASCIIQNTPKKVSDKTKLKLKANEESILKNVTEKCDASGFSDSSNKSFILENSSIPDVNSQVYFEIPQNCELNEIESTQKTKNDSCKTKKHLYQEEACCSNRNRYGYDLDNEPIHMTLEEVKTSLKQLYENKNFQEPAKSTHYSSMNPTEEKPSRAQIKKGFHICLRHKKSRDGNDCDHEKRVQHRKSFPTTLKQTFCSWFGKKNSSPKRARTRGHSKSHEELSYNDILSSNLLSTPSRSIPSLSPFVNRALPPVPSSSRNDDNQQLKEDQAFNNDQERSESPTMADATSIDFTSSIHKVKDCGWYWGPISGEMAERILASEPDGSFIVRDSSDEHYIFSLTFKLNGLVRHVRIEHNQGKFSFGNFTNFKSQTIVGFIENAVEHSRSGRYLFFLHRRPLLGPMRVQLLHPVSRFKQVQSLQHMCRFVVLKCVRRDLIYKLPLPKRLKDYLNTPQYYTENMDMMTDEDINTPVLPATTPEQNLLHGELTNPSYR